MIASCARLAGQSVVDRRGEDVGRIDRILVEVATGRIVGVVIAVGGVFGLGARYHTVAWPDLGVDVLRHRVEVARPLRDAAAESPLSTL